MIPVNAICRVYSVYDADVCLLWASVAMEGTVVVRRIKIHSDGVRTVVGFFRREVMHYTPEAQGRISQNFHEGSSESSNGLTMKCL